MTTEATPVVPDITEDDLKILNLEGIDGWYANDSRITATAANAQQLKDSLLAALRLFAESKRQNKILRDWLPVELAEYEDDLVRHMPICDRVTLGHQRINAYEGTL